MQPLESRAKFLALAKAKCAARNDEIVIGSDTIVGLGHEALGKPQDVADAKSMLERLSGRSHVVITGVGIVWPEGSHAFAETATVHFRELSRSEIEAYVAGGEPMDKAGSYAIQGGAAQFGEVVEGDMDTVIGLPVASLANALEAHGLAHR
jgi:septum formation protein